MSSGIGRLLPISAFIVSLIFLIPRIGPGLPMGVDSTSHLYKVIFIFKSYKEHGYIPFWTPDWYGGTPLLLLYPPLSYYISFILSLGGIDPVSSYKIVEAFFYIIAPYSLYRLGRELSLAEAEGWIAALLFSFSPAIIDNMIFYDRFPTICSIPLLCFYLTYFYRTFKDGFNLKGGIISAFLLALLILIHHLSALLAVLISIIAILSSLLDFRKVIHGLGSLTFIFTVSLGVSSLWLIPFLDTSKFVAENPFYNRNVMDVSFAKVSFFIKESILNFGLLHFLLAMTMLGILLHSSVKRGRYLFSSFTSILFLGLFLFEVGINLNSSTLKMISQSVIVLLFASLTVGVILLTGKTKRWSYGFLSLWFIIFLWFGLGGFMVPFTSEMSPPFMKFPFIPYVWSKLDIHRFWLYLTIPASILAAPIMARILGEIKFNRVYRWAMLGLILFLAVGGIVKAAWSLTHPINEYLPQDYTVANQNVPEGIIRYLSSDPWNGRILAIHCPFWIYLLPLYLDDKTIIDGWYPQGKILEPLYRINDYRLNDLEATVNDTERVRHWRNLIDSSDILGINWILIGGSNESFKSLLVSDSEFKEAYSEPYGEGSITIYRSIVRHSLVSWTPYSHGKISYNRDAPDKIRLKILGDFEAINITVREAYFPTWSARYDGREIEVSRDELNFIFLRFDELKTGSNIEIYHSYDWRVPASLSAISSASLLILFLYAKMRRREKA